LVDLDAVPALVASQVEAVRVFVGYAGWSPGQLEGELRTGSWYAVDARREDTFTLDPDALWAQVLRRQPGELSWVALLPEDPSIN
jgi:putative transcriptional regulator